MALSSKIQGATFSRNIGALTLPTVDGLVSEHLFGGSEGASVVNMADPDGTALTPVGSAVYGEAYAEIKSGGAYGSIGFTLPIACPDDATLIVVVQKVTACPAFLYSDPNCGFFNYTSVPAVYNSQSGTAAQVANLPVPGHTDFTFYAAQMPLGGLGKIFAYESGVLSSDTADNPGGARGPALLTIGTTTTNAGIGVANIAYAAVFDRVLSDAEIADSYASLKAYLATRGLTVS